MTPQFIQAADGCQLAFYVQGQGEPLVLLSGQAQDHSIWRLSLPFLSAHFQVILVDYRGTGASDKPKTPAYSLLDFATDIIQVLHHLKLSQAHIYGLSMGGRVAQLLGIHYPTYVKSLILGATTPGKQGIARDAQANAWLQAGDIKHMVALMYSADFAQAHPDLIAPCPTPAYARRLHYLASEAHDALQDLKHIYAPSLILHGTDDRINPTANAYLMAEQLPNAQLCLLENAKHGYIDEYAEQACQLIVKFIQNLP